MAGRAVDYYLSAVWTSDRRKNAARRVLVFLRLSSVRCDVKAEDWGLLCLLQLWISTMPTHSDGIVMSFLKFGCKAAQM
jgi:hypothetical protein